MPSTDGSKSLPGSLYNQRLQAWHPILTPTWVIVAFAIVAAIFIPVGIWLKGESDGVQEVVCKYSSGQGSSACLINGCNRVEKEMAAPVYLYYELDNFYQNHRRYVKSRSDSQLRGEILSASSLSSDCDPLIYGDIPNSKGELRVLHPCGLIANSYFNDTFALRAAQHDGNNVPVSWSESGISWATDRLNKFKALYARIDTTLKANTRLSIDIGENFPVKQFGGAKSVVISTLSILGGKNDFLGIAYIAVGAVCAAMAVAFLIKECTCPRRPGDLKYLRLSAR
ncbi:hypothetical protein FNF28_00487 [Cafeteria roenbergensis]|uniref:ALA-interacting subunit n=1 Tax=Cafeteria roenbergensis TaxID=33653 RepID=A0A5A8E263_CAFRO|nr:hypothetical protein FNF28_00487 [Cafeteria roenbergensis]